MSQKHLRSLISAALLIMLLVPSTGCTFLRQLLGQIKAPLVKVLRVEPELKSLERAVLRFTIAIKNPNPVGIKLRGIGYSLDVEGRKVASGRTRRGLRLRPSGRSRAQVDVTVQLVKVASSLLELLGKGRARYEGTFRLAFDTPIGVIDVPVRHRGVFPLPKRPPVVIESLRVASLGPGGVQLLCNVRVDNPNPFAMPIDALRLGLKINNRSLATVTGPPGLRMQPGQPLRIPLRINASLPALGLAVTDLARRPTLSYQASLKLASGPLQIPATARGSFRLMR